MLASSAQGCRAQKQGAAGRYCALAFPAHLCVPAAVPEQDSESDSGGRPHVHLWVLRFNFQKA